MMDKDMERLSKAANKCIYDEISFEEYDKIHKEVLGR